MAFMRDLLRAHRGRTPRGKSPVDAGWSALKSHFHALVELRPAERASRLRRLAESDPALHRRLVPLLDADAGLPPLRVPGDGPTSIAYAADDPPACVPEAAPLAAPVDPLELAGTVVSHFRVGGVLGSGGMGVVYDAEDVTLGRRVALKFLRPRLSLDPAGKTRLLQEARAASALDHPSICTVHEIGETADGRLFIAMARYDGETLRERLDREGPLPVDLALRVTRQVLRGLVVAHRAGVVHRDLKPANLFLTREVQVKILDFGLAQVRDPGTDAAGTGAGTVAYMSPEQLRGQGVNERTDLWSLGAVLHEMLTGTPPYGDGHDLSTLYAILHEGVVPASLARRDVDSSVDAVIGQLLCKGAADRCASASAALEALQRAETAPTTRRLRRVRRGSLVTVGLLAAASAALLATRDAPVAQDGSARAAAHELYLRGVFHWSRRSRTDLGRARLLFEQAARTDPTYAQPHAGLALTHAVSIVNVWRGGSAAHSLRETERAAARAIALDPARGEAYAALGYAYHWSWRWTDAERSLRQAIAFSPRYASAHEWYGEHLVKMGRFEEGLAALRRAVALDSLSLVAHNDLGLGLGLARRFPEAIAQLERTHALDPGFPIPPFLLHRFHLLAGDPEAAADWGRRWAELTGADPAEMVLLSRAIGDPAQRAAAGAVLAAWERRSEPPSPDIAFYAALMGDPDRALAALERGLAERSPMMAQVKVAPWLDPLRAEPRFQRIVQELRFPP